MNSQNHYWMHRVSYEDGFSIFENEKKITIGFSEAAASDELCEALTVNCDYDKFCTAYTKVYRGNIERSKNHLWRFVAKMKRDDIVVVPWPLGFYVCKLKGDVAKCNRPGLDLGWEWDVDLISEFRTPRDAYAQAGLLRCMKCPQTNLCIDDLREDVDFAYTCKPFNLVQNVTETLLKAIRDNGSPERLEEYVAAMFESMGAEVEILPKNYVGKKGDCDVEAIFEFLHLVISVQCKKHEGTTDDCGVKQIAKYSDNKVRKSGWNYWKWVISTADAFSQEASDAAKQKDIRLICGNELSRMLLRCGLK